MRKFFSLIILLAISCTSFRQITLYKDKNVLDSPVFTNSIDDFGWAFKSENIFDTLVFTGKHLKEIELLISNLDKVPNHQDRMGSPRYAFVMDNKGETDTLYFYDFADKGHKDIGYLVKSNIVVRDTNYRLRKYLLKHFKEFICREYYYIPGSDKEHYYFKDK